MKQGDLKMFSNKKYTSFSNDEEKIAYLKKWNLLSKTKTAVPEYYLLLDHKEYVCCDIIGFEKDYDTFSIAVVDYGCGPYFIHCDYLKDMQKSFRESKNKRKEGRLLDVMPDSYVIFDLETTDLSIYKAEIIEIGALKIDNGSIVDEFSVFVKPSIPIPEKITKITGITDLMVWNAQSIHIVLQQFIDFIEDYPLVGYNINQYDMNILKEQSKGKPALQIENDYVDLLLLFRKLLPKDKFDIKNHKLITIAEYFDIDTSNAHRALDDCYLCYECLNNVLNPNHTSDDVSIVTSSDNLFEECIINKLKSINDELELLENSIILVENKSTKLKHKTKSIVISEKEYPLIHKEKIPLNKRIVKLSIFSDEVTLFYKTKFDLEKVLLPSSAKIKILKTKQSATFDNLEDLLNYLDVYIRHCVDHYSSSASFGCCSKHIECSDALKCLHENKLYSTGCYYRKNLENGRIFYGKNRNIK